MVLVVIFDKDIDVIDVPQTVIDNIELFKKKFIRWMYSKNNSKYRKKYIDSNGCSFYGVQYRSDAFVNWLNQKVLCNSQERASVLIQQAPNYPDNAPKLFF